MKIFRLAWIPFALALAACGGGMDTYEAYAPAMSEAQVFPVHGIDVSKFQGDIDWNAVAHSNVKFAWIKATEGGDYLDAKFAQNWEGARAAGVPRGAYHFVYWCRTPQEEMAWFEANVPVEADALPPVLDVEATPDSRTCRKRLQRGPTISDMRWMLQEMERHYGKKPIIYTTVDFYRAILAGGALSDYPVWVRSTKYHPSKTYRRAWSFWQYQSDGHVPGIRGKVDRNAFYGDAHQWRTFLADNVKTPPVPPIAVAAAPRPLAPVQLSQN